MAHKIIDWFFQAGGGETGPGFPAGGPKGIRQRKPLPHAKLRRRNQFGT